VPARERREACLTAMDRRKALIAALAVALSLAAGSPPRTEGDGGEYVALALNFAAFHGPAIAEDAISGLQATIGRHEPRLAQWDIEKSSVAGRGGGRDFVHFWFYSALATPAIWVTSAVGAHPAFAFTALNLALLGLALWLCLPRLGAPVSLLLFCGPIVWWIDKPHTEAFTFSLLAIAFALFRERPWWSAVAAGAAATQNPPIAVLPVLIVAAAAATRRAFLRDARFWWGAAAGVSLALLHPLYYLVTHGTPSLLIPTTRQALPRIDEWSAVIVDPNIGLLANFPAIVIAALAGLLVVLKRRPGELLSSDVVSAGIASAVFLFSFAQTANVHHGATPSISRYALWLVPLLIPLLVRAVRLGGRLWTTGIWLLAPASALVCVFAFHPRMPENSREPTLLADFLWSKHPGWNNPLPEVFVEAISGSEDSWLPAATPRCEKVLLWDRGDGERWPLPCFPAAPPRACVGSGFLCYANLEQGKYEFAQAAIPDGKHFRIRREFLWPASAEPRVRKLFIEFEWWRLRLVGSDSPVLRSAHGVERVWVYEGPDRYLFVVLRPGPDAGLVLRPPQRMKGRLLDAESDGPEDEVRFDGAPHEVWHVPLPVGPKVVILALASVGEE
jgi:hypothetical protein